MEGKHGVCQTGREAVVACAFPHRGEESVLRGTHGSGTIFFSQCNLRCVFCQNYETSQLGEGRPVTAAGLANLMLGLQEAGCHNLNFVTPSHVVPQILEGLSIAVEHGLELPLVYNTSGYDSLETLGLLRGVVDIYMPDFKLWFPEPCRRFLLAEDYGEVARAALKAMHLQVGDLEVQTDGVARRGLLVRHLVMPGGLEDTRAIVNWLARELSPDTYLNLMDQYHPAGRVPGEPRFAALHRRITGAEFRQAERLARDAGLWRLDPCGA